MSKLKEFTEEELETRGVDGFINITKGTTGVSMQKTAIASGKKRGLKYNEEYGLVAEAKTDEAAKKLFDQFIEQYDLEPLSGKKKKTVKKAEKKVEKKAEKKKVEKKKVESEEEEEEEDEPTGPVDKSKITVPQLKDYLKKRSIEFTSKMLKDKLYELYVESFEESPAPDSKKKAPASPKAKKKKEEEKDEEEGEDDEPRIFRPASIPPVPKPGAKPEKKAPAKAPAKPPAKAPEKKAPEKKAPAKAPEKKAPQSPRDIAGLEEEVSFPGEIVPAKRVPIARPPPSDKPKLTKEQKFEKLLKCWTESKVEVTRSPRSPGKK
jgi:hypothetical protein